jgi:hypothetical protein
MAAQSFIQEWQKFCAPSSGCESVMNAVHSSQYSTENLLVKASAVASMVSYCKQGGRRDATSCVLHCQVWRRRSVCQFRVRQRAESQAQDLSGSWPADRCLDEEFCILSPRFLTCSPAPPASPDFRVRRGKKSGRPGDPEIGSILEKF